VYIEIYILVQKNLSKFIYIYIYIFFFFFISRAAKSGTHIQAGWSKRAYEASKIGVSALAGIHQSMFNVDSRKDIAVNAVHPGYVDTDMTNHKGPLTPDEGALAPVYCALLPENTEIKGKYIWCDMTLSNWK